MFSVSKKIPIADKDKDPSFSVKQDRAEDARV
jgi:hypothetical protein